MGTLGSGAGPIHLLTSRDWRGQVVSSMAPTEFVVWAAFLQRGVSQAGTVPSPGPCDWRPRLQIFCPELFPLELIISFLY